MVDSGRNFLRIIVAYNPRSSRNGLVSSGVIDKIREEKGIILGKFEIKPTNPGDNAKNLAKIIQGGELVLAAGGDGTATIALNGVILAREKYGKEASFSALPFGNFNDFSRMLGDLDVSEVVRKFRKKSFADFYPVRAEVNGKEAWNFGTYFTVGMMAESTRAFEDKEVRKKLRTGKKGLFFSGKTLFFWFMKNKRRRFLADFSLKRVCFNEKDDYNEEEFFKGATDYVAMNGGTVAKMIKIPRSSNGKEYFKEERKFYSGAEKFTGLVRLLRIGLFRIMIKHKFPGRETEGDRLEFREPATVFIHAEGEAKKIERVKEIKISKLEKPIKVILGEKNERE